MNTKDVIKQAKKDGFSLLHSHDGDFTRHRIDFYSDGTFACLLNEKRCFRRGTHDAMAKVHGIDLLLMNPAPYVARQRRKVAPSERTCSLLPNRQDQFVAAMRDSNA